MKIKHRWVIGKSLGSGPAVMGHVEPGILAANREECHLQEASAEIHQLLEGDADNG